MTAMLDYEVVDGAPSEARAVEMVLSNIRACAPGWLAGQAVPTAPCLADAERLLDGLLKEEPEALSQIVDWATESLESFEAPEDAYFGAVDLLELIGLANWRADNPAPGETWNESRVRMGGRNGPPLAEAA